MRRDRPVIDDAAAARRLRLHDLDRFLRAQERSGEVGRHHAEPGLVGQFLQRHGRRAAAGIVENPLLFLVHELARNLLVQLIVV